MPVIRTCPHCGQKTVSPQPIWQIQAVAAPARTPCPQSPSLSSPTPRSSTTSSRTRVSPCSSISGPHGWPCRMAAPEVARTAADLAGQAIVLKVDSDKHPDLAARYNVRGIPNFIVLSGGKLVHQQAGVVGHDQMEGWLRSAASATVSA